jgi:hypothetical protein
MKRSELEHYGWDIKEGDDLENAWERAFRFNRFTKAEAEAGDIMYMCSDRSGRDYFKDKNTRISR